MKNFESEKNIFSKNQIRKKMFFGNFRSQKAQKRSFVEKLELSLQAGFFENACPLLEPITFIMVSTLSKLTFNGPFFLMWINMTSANEHECR